MSFQGRMRNFCWRGLTRRRPVKGDRFEKPNPLPVLWLFWILVSMQHCVSIDNYLQLLLAVNY